VLFGASPGASGSGLKYFEFDGTSLTGVPAPALALSDATSFTSLLVLPSGQVMFVDGSTTVQLYTPAGSPTYNPAWAPTISVVPLSISNATTYQIFGTQFNGLNQGTAYGDESQNATNYPLVRITNNATGHVFYAKTHDHSTMGVATGTTTVFTNFDVPAKIEAGDSTIQVVANGVPSAAVAITVSLLTYATATSASSTSNPSVFGQSVTFTSTTTSSGGVPTGMVTFKDGTATLGTGTLNASGHATLTTSTLAVGAHSITAVYGGNASFNTSTSPALTQTVNQDGTATQLTSSRKHSRLNQSVTFTAKVIANAPGTAVPAGTVTFKDGTNTLNSVSLNASGQASFTISTLSTGTHQITAVYGGSSSFLTSTSPVLIFTVN
jgi:Bacterial Ig-like domain (group 3)